MTIKQDWFGLGLLEARLSVSQAEGGLSVLEPARLGLKSLPGTR